MKNNGQNVTENLIQKVREAQSILEKRGISVENQTPDMLASLSNLSLEGVYSVINLEK